MTQHKCLEVRDLLIHLANNRAIVHKEGIAELMIFLNNGRICRNKEKKVIIHSAKIKREKDSIIPGQVAVQVEGKPLIVTQKKWLMTSSMNSLSRMKGWVLSNSKNRNKNIKTNPSKILLKNFKSYKKKQLKIYKKRWASNIGKEEAEDLEMKDLIHLLFSDNKVQKLTKTLIYLVY